MANDTVDGTGSVYIEGKEVGKKNSSAYKKCSGNQPATRSFGMDLVSHVLEGKTKFQAYSFDVMFEKGGADRFMDMTTSNHSNNGTATTMSAADLAITPEMEAACEALRIEVNRMRQASNDASNRDRSEGRRNKRMFGALTASKTATSGIERRASCNANATACMRADPPIPVKGKKGTQGAAKSKKSDVCGGGKPYANMEHKNHTEAQMLEGLDWSNPPQWVAFATDWPGYDRKTKRCDPALANGPCDECKKKLDEACACNVAIIICDSDGNAKNHCDKSG
jgi:hypothetical protein